MAAPAEESPLLIAASCDSRLAAAFMRGVAEPLVLGRAPTVLVLRSRSMAVWTSVWVIPSLRI